MFHRLALGMQQIFHRSFLDVPQVCHRHTIYIFFGGGGPYGVGCPDRGGVSKKKKKKKVESNKKKKNVFFLSPPGTLGNHLQFL